jgi:hypothetical protein
MLAFTDLHPGEGRLSVVSGVGALTKQQFIQNHQQLDGGDSRVTIAFLLQLQGSFGLSTVSLENQFDMVIAAGTSMT